FAIITAANDEHSWPAVFPGNEIGKLCVVGLTGYIPMNTRHEFLRELLQLTRRRQGCAAVIGEIFDSKNAADFVDEYRNAVDNRKGQRAIGVKAMDADSSHFHFVFANRTTERAEKLLRDFETTVAGLVCWRHVSFRGHL